VKMRERKLFQNEVSPPEPFPVLLTTPPVEKNKIQRTQEERY
jgi:hypothetical protein